MTERSKTTDLVPSAPDEVQRVDEPPVVARLVVEIRSDGTRTIAIGFVQLECVHVAILHAGRWHAIRVEVRDRRLNVRARRGYVAS